jgi:hypothetical protein
LNLDTGLLTVFNPYRVIPMTILGKPPGNVNPSLERHGHFLPSIFSWCNLLS